LNTPDLDYRSRKARENDVQIDFWVSLTEKFNVFVVKVLCWMRESADHQALT
jgi:hypothetical protein